LGAAPQRHGDLKVAATVTPDRRRSISPREQRRDLSASNTVDFFPPFALWAGATMGCAP